MRVSGLSVSFDKQELSTYAKCGDGHGWHPLHPRLSVLSQRMSDRCIEEQFPCPSLHTHTYSRCVNIIVHIFRLSAVSLNETLGTEDGRTDGRERQIVATWNLKYPLLNFSE